MLFSRKISSSVFTLSRSAAASRYGFLAAAQQQQGYHRVVREAFINSRNMKDMERVSSMRSTTTMDDLALNTDLAQSTLRSSSTSKGSLLKREQALLTNMEKLANVDPALKKLLKEYSDEIAVVMNDDSPQATSMMDSELVHRLHECNLKVHRYLTKVVSSHLLQEMRFLSLVNSELAHECVEMNSLLEKHMFSL
ncbi:hypothetical protein C9374_000612 [Naegleria lovaniensis]|uniref:Uncharacterized protein n=1 Tax=Naegleria lovaniensis TaxID=51637 RepID=A0AA88KND9_NAELO|nr:uncharacterized protein C9374_000612 [Naegleria lovaniensis]KAG2388448.1 hypothetical protein C9374_000612 [Naegleria lovaniensis]